MRLPRQVTVKVMPAGDGRGSILTYRIPRWRILVGRFSPYALGLLAFGLAIQAGFHLSKAHELRALERENVALRSRVESIDERVATLSLAVRRVQQFDARLREMTLFSDPERNLAVGPIGMDDSARRPDPSRSGATELRRDLMGDGGHERALGLIEERIDAAADEAQQVQKSVETLRLYLEDQQSLLVSTPSLKPTKGWRTSDFGWRTDPYTGLRQLHAGVDIAGNAGQEVIAPGEGLVTAAGEQGAYGNVVVIDHGHGLTSVFGHLSEFLVKLGDDVKRGSPIGKVGNTGRSTGPHLHYEIRLNGVPQNPDRFILE